MRNIFHLLIIGLLFTGCASPQKQFSKGNYQKAYNGALKELQKKNDRKLKQILNRSFTEILNDKTYRIDRLSNTSILKDWEEAFVLYMEIEEDYMEGKRFLDMHFDTVVTQLLDEQAILALAIGDRFEALAFDNMEEFERRNDKEAAQQAHKYFIKLSYYNPDYPSVQGLIDDSYEAGLVNILIDVNTWDYKYQWDIDQQFRNIENADRNFTRFHYNTIVADVDCEVDLNFDNLRIIETKSESQTHNYTKLIQDGFETIIDASGNSVQKPKYIQVEGFVTTVVNQKQFEWQVNMMVDRYSQYCKLSPRTFTSRQNTSKNEYQTSGDLRAIPDEFKFNNKSTEFDQNERRIIENLIQDLYNQILSHIN